MKNTRSIIQLDFFVPAGLVSLIALGAFFLIGVYPHVNRTTLTTMVIFYNPTRSTDLIPKLKYKDTIAISSGQLSTSGGIDRFGSEVNTYLQSSDTSLGLVISISRDCKYNDFVEICDMLNMANLPFELLGSTIKVWKFRSHDGLPPFYDYIGGGYPLGYPSSTRNRILDFRIGALSDQLAQIRREIETFHWAIPEYILIISWSILFAFGLRSSYVHFENRRARKHPSSFSATPNRQNNNIGTGLE